MSLKSTTVKFNKASCYYCNEWFENNEIESHIAACEQILQKCSNGCGAYVPQRDMNRHLNRCPAGFGEQLSADQEKTLELEQEIIALRGTLNDEIRQRLALITDIGQLKKRTQLGDEWTAKVGDVLNKLKKVINEETDSRCVDVERCKADINELMRQYERIEVWRLELTTRFNQLEVQLKKEVDMDAENGKPKDAKMVLIESKLNYLQSEVESLRTAQAQQQPKGQEPLSNCRAERDVAAIEELAIKMQTVDLVLEDHHNSIRSFQEQVQRQMFDLRGEMDPMRLVIQEQLDKQARLDYELKSVLNTVHETEDAGEKTQKTLEKYRRETYYTKQNLDDLQVHLQHQEKLVVIQNTQGHLIWRIDQFDRRFKESQQSEFMMKSPMFSNRPFGYTLRLEASLNGIGTWRGRNMIVGLVVAGGYYDNLLEWPCVLSGVITLRDQPEDRSKAEPVDYSRSIMARRKHQNYDKNQYIHIPHSVLRSEHYIRDDTIFVEVRIDQ